MKFNNKYQPMLIFAALALGVVLGGMLNFPSTADYLVKNKMIISDGYNGTPSGFENCCEDEDNLTKWYVLHAEANAILKVARSTQSCEDATLYITLSPCKDCSKLIHQSGIKRVVYHQEYKDTSGVDFLRKAGVEVELIEDLD